MMIFLKNRFFFPVYNSSCLPSKYRRSHRFFRRQQTGRGCDEPPHVFDGGEVSLRGLPSISSPATRDHSLAARRPAEALRQAARRRGPSVPHRKGHGLAGELMACWFANLASEWLAGCLSQEGTFERMSCSGLIWKRISLFQIRH